ncbi:hypothetical protein L9F63_026619, partial [Diploptera punctata]
KNPEPVCAFVPYTTLSLCAVFSNVYFAGRNLHICIAMQSQWRDRKLFDVSLDCVRVGANGIVRLKPEDGGGLPTNVFTQDNDQYDYVDIL